MRISHTVILLAVWAVPGAGTALADPPGYRLTPSDTLRYRYVSDATVVTKAAQSTLNGSVRVDAIAVFAGAEGDSATAWFKRLIVIQRGPEGVERPDTDSLLGLPFRLHFPASGRVSVASTPAIPQEVQSMADLRGQFGTMFVTLPAVELKPGVSWADTIQQNREEGAQKTEGRTIREYKVLRDTLVAETPAVVLSVLEKRKLRGTRHLEEQQGTADVDLQGKEEGIAVFAPGAGRLLARRSQGVLEGSIGFEGSGSRMSFSQRLEFTSALDLLP